MENSQILSYDNNIQTVWSLIVLGPESKFNGVDSKSIHSLSVCSKLFYDIIRRENMQINYSYWKQRYLDKFQCLYKVNPDAKLRWCNLLIYCQKEINNLNNICQNALSSAKIQPKQKGYPWLESYTASLSQSNLRIFADLERYIPYISQTNANPQTQYYLGLSYLKGLGTKQDNQKAFEYFKLSADQEHSEAQLQLGKCFQSGIGVVEDKEKAFDCFKYLVKQGNLEALKLVISFYTDGVGIYQNEYMASEYSKILKLLSAMTSHGEEQITLAQYYDQGRILNENREKAFDCYKNAADQGILEAQYEVGRRYYEGDGIAANTENSFKYYLLAADKGHIKSIFRVAACYSLGLDIPKDDFLALDYYELVIIKGTSDDAAKAASFQLFLEKKLKATQDIESFQMYKLLADQGNYRAQDILCHIYNRFDPYGDKNDEGTFKYYKLLAHNECANSKLRGEAQFQIGRWYETGDRVAKNKQKAFYYYELSKETGNIDGVNAYNNFIEGYPNPVQGKVTNDQTSKQFFFENLDYVKRLNISSSQFQEFEMTVKNLSHQIDQEELSIHDAQSIIDGLTSGHLLKEPEIRNREITYIAALDLSKEDADATLGVFEDFADDLDAGNLIRNQGKAYIEALDLSGEDVEATLAVFEGLADDLEAGNLTMIEVQQQLEEMGMTIGVTDNLAVGNAT